MCGARREVKQIAEGTRAKKDIATALLLRQVPTGLSGEHRDNAGY